MKFPLSRTGQIRISSSSLSLYESCPYAWKLQYKDKVVTPTRTNPFAAFGIAIHSVIQGWYQRQVFTRADLISCWKDVFEKTFNDPDVEEVDTSLRIYLYNKGVPMLNVFFNRQRLDGLIVSAFGVETPFEIPWQSPYGLVHITGRIDLYINGPEGVEIIDFKTGKNPQTQEQVDQDAQLTFYSMAYRYFRRLDPVKYLQLERWVTLHYLATDLRIKSVRGKQHYESLLARITKMLQGVDENNFVACPSAENCKYCDLGTYKICKAIEL